MKAKKMWYDALGHKFIEAHHGKYVEIEGFEWMHLFVFRGYSGEFSVTCSLTGALVGKGETPKKAVKDARKRFRRIAPKVFVKSMKRYIGTNGKAPGVPKKWYKTAKKEWKKLLKGGGKKCSTSRKK